MAAGVLIVDDHPVVRKGIRSLLSTSPGLEVVGEAGSGEEALSAYRETRPDVVLLDIRLAGASGLEVLSEILQLDPDARVLMLSSFDDREYVDRSLTAGALGYVLKGDSDSVLITAIETAARGQRALSPQVTDRLVTRLYGDEDPTAAAADEFDDTDRRLLRLLAEGASNTEIAEQLYMSDSTVKRRLRGIFERLGVARRPEAVAEAVRRGLV